jgi:hypothetical protein
MMLTDEQITQKIEEFLVQNPQYQGLKLYIADDFLIFTVAQHAHAYARLHSNPCRYVWTYQAGKIHLSFDVKAERPVKNDEMFYYHRHFS